MKKKGAKVCGGQFDRLPFLSSNLNTEKKIKNGSEVRAGEERVRGWEAKARDIRRSLPKVVLLRSPLSQENLIRMYRAAGLSLFLSLNLTPSLPHSLCLSSNFLSLSPFGVYECLFISNICIFPQTHLCIQRGERCDSCSYKYLKF